MGIREGLSFSDYFDDQVPADVKPAYSLTPMQETESELTRLIGQGWLDKHGNYRSVSSHYQWAVSYLNSKDIDYDEDTIYDKMYELGFLRTVGIQSARKLYFDHHDKIEPTPIQMRIMRNYCIDIGWKLYDDTLQKEIDLMNESVNEQDFPIQAKDLFKGLHESGPTILQNREDYWMNPAGEFLIAKNGHAMWAVKYLIAHNIHDYENDEPRQKMFELGFVRVKVQHHEIYVDYTVGQQLKNIQWRNLKNAAIESDMKLIDTSGVHQRREVDLFENTNRTLFIESMMPDNMDTFKSHLAQLFAYLQKELQLKTVPKVKLMSDDKNADKVLGKTAYYNPQEKLVVLYITNRHQKDILRSFAHEIIHHWQHENEKLNVSQGESDPKYAQNNPWLRQMEKQAYLLGNILFRDWEDDKKNKDRKSGKKMTEKTMVIGKAYPPNKPNYEG